MNKFALWMDENDKVQAGVARKLGISKSTLNNILHLNHMPSLPVAIEIERYTQGAVTVYDWIEDHPKQPSTKTIKKKTTINII